MVSSPHGYTVFIAFVIGRVFYSLEYVKIYFKKNRIGLKLLFLKKSNWFKKIGYCVVFLGLGSFASS